MKRKIIKYSNIPPSANVIKRWLSYRKQSLPGRPLKKEEAREVMNMARRIAAIVLLVPGLNENYRRVKKDTMIGL